MLGGTLAGQKIPALSAGTAPNQLWCADFKGEFKLGNRQYRYLLTVADQASRFLLMCEVLQSTKEITTFTAGQGLGIKEVEDGIWLVSFMQHDLGYTDLEQKTLQTIDNPFGTKVSPMS